MEKYLSIEGLADYLGVAEKSVRKWVLNRDIPFHKVMKLVRFRLSEIEQWIEAGGKFLGAAGDGEPDEGLFDVEGEAAGHDVGTGGADD